MTPWGDDDDPSSPLVEDTRTETGWDTIRRVYAGGHKVPVLERVIALAKQHGVRSVLIERRYFDPDWRSMYAKFYGSLYQPYSPTCHRLHLFSEVLEQPEDLHLHRQSYKGYTVLRSLPSHPVGRTMIRPPDDQPRSAFCLASETVRPLGYELQVEAMPFMSQDGEYMRCSHVVQWMALHHAHLLRRFARRLPEDVHLSSQGGLVVGRQVPSGGLSLAQMLGSLHALGVSPDLVSLTGGGQEESQRRGIFSLPATICRYVNSQMPPIVISANHAWVVVGYRNDGTGSTHDSTSFFVHDDMRGPYHEISNPWATGRDTWQLAVPPLPQRVNLSADRAELVGRVAFLRAVFQEGGSDWIRRAIDNDELTFRTYAIRANEFKAQLEARDLPPSLCARYRLTNWPGFIWVVEVLDRGRFRRLEPCVIGEVVIDSTATHVVSTDRRSPWPARAVLAMRFPGKAVITAAPSRPDAGEGDADGAAEDDGDRIDAHAGMGEWLGRNRAAYTLRLDDEQEIRHYASGCPSGNW